MKYKHFKTHSALCLITRTVYDSTINIIFKMFFVNSSASKPIQTKQVESFNPLSINKL